MQTSRSISRSPANINTMPSVEECEKAQDPLNILPEPAILRSSFLSLPPEIRNQVYKISLQLKPRKKKKQHFEYARLLAIRAEHLSSWLLSQQKETNIVRTNTGIGLLGTCRQVLKEAAPMFYSEKTIIFQDGSMASFLSFLEWCREFDILKHIRQINVTVSTPGRENNTYENWLTSLGILAKNASGLKELRICFHHEGRRLPNNEEITAREASTEKHNPIEFSRDKRSARAVAEIKQVDTLKVRGFSSKEWPAVLDEYMHSDFVVQHCGFAYTMYDPETMYIKREKFLHVIYKRKDQVSAWLIDRGSWTRNAIDGPLVKLVQEIGQ